MFKNQVILISNISNFINNVSNVINSYFNGIYAPSFWLYQALTSMRAALLIYIRNILSFGGKYCYTESVTVTLSERHYIVRKTMDTATRIFSRASFSK